MKRVLFTVVAIMAFAVASNAQGVLKFEAEKHDFGTLAEGPVANYTFKVTNTGTAPVVISRAMASCGCTTPEWSTDPILPGASSSIKVGYNTSGRPGNFKKTITVTSNAENSTVILTINGSVTPKSKTK
ncbi:DUF1573 domain-containing protein [Arcticibacterium luteifluviistationis]|uniref:DUF1573 domain-containing protein n=1 Tax=Arcticibacterium luteifluviistationis TaxID=1784714 RepID=A0A2Z4GGA8_9BACT|nr:DUF1573 domain-containing protein [Arcticibacterium luteifluviistationis]AWW00108.1 DUF1573 domain-containing protein [Arcticibacterium luteifluviistationis]